MSTLTRNLLANFGGQIWFAILGFALAPLFIRFMGIESYGLVGLFFTLEAVLQAFDFGLSPTLNREMARYSVQADGVAEARDLVRTLEIGYWVIGLLLGLLIFLAAPYVATTWIKPKALSTDIVEQAVKCMGVLLFLEWPVSFYLGGLLGLQRQVGANAIRIGVATFRYMGAAAILLLASRSVIAFLDWQIVASTVQVALLAGYLWWSLGLRGQTPRFRPELVRSIWRFAAGMAAISVGAVFLSQIDKVILSNLLSLEMFGYYVLACVVANGLVIIIDPVFAALFPRFSALAATGDYQSLGELYHRGSQLMAVLILPTAIVLSLFASDVIMLWTGDAAISLNAGPIVAMRVAGTALNGLIYLPYTLQLAFGWTRIGVYITLFLIAIFVPAILLLASSYGAVGAAAAWVLVNGLYVLISVPLTHRRLLVGQAGRWVFGDVASPALGALFVGLLSRVLLTSPMSRAETLVVMPGVLACAILAAAMMSSQARRWLVQHKGNIKAPRPMA